MVSFSEERARKRGEGFFYLTQVLNYPGGTL